MSLCLIYRQTMQNKLVRVQLLRGNFAVSGFAIAGKSIIITEVYFI